MNKKEIHQYLFENYKKLGRVDIPEKDPLSTNEHTFLIKELYREKKINMIEHMKGISIFMVLDPSIFDDKENMSIMPCSVNAVNAIVGSNNANINNDKKTTNFLPNWFSNVTFSNPKFYTPVGIVGLTAIATLIWKVILPMFQ